MRKPTEKRTLIIVPFRRADSLPRELLDDWLRARDAFLAANPPPWDDITEAYYHGQFSDKLAELLPATRGSCETRSRTNLQADAPSPSWIGQVISAPN